MLKQLSRAVTCSHRCNYTFSPCVSVCRYLSVNKWYKTQQTSPYAALHGAATWRV